MTASSDLLRLLALPVLGWAAHRDWLTRRVPTRTWYPLFALGVLLLVVDGWTAFGGSPYETRAFAIRVAVSIGLIVPLAYGFHHLGGFGAADAKAFVVVAVLFPTFPTYDLAGITFPLETTTLGVFSLTILTNTVLAGAAYPAVLALRNAVSGQVSRAMVVGRPIPWDETMQTHGRLLETADGFTVRGLDLDALRMYLRWRGLGLTDIRTDPDRYRDPASLPADPNHPTDGAVERGRETDIAPTGDPSTARVATPDGNGSAGADATDPDPWGARTFLDDIDHGAYGTRPDQLRSALDLLAEADRVWVSPGLPFLVPLVVGIVVALVYGDVLFAVLRLLGMV